MKTSKKMAKVITEIAAQHGLDLSVPGQDLVLYNEPYTRLVIGVEAETLVSVAHCPLPEPGEDSVSDPDMLFYTGYGVEAGWVPVEVTLATGQYQLATVLKDGHPCGFYDRAQREQVDLANLWARNLREQGWLRHAHRDVQEEAPPLPVLTLAEHQRAVEMARAVVAQLDTEIDLNPAPAPPGDAVDWDRPELCLACGEYLDEAGHCTAPAEVHAAGVREWTEWMAQREAEEKAAILAAVPGGVCQGCGAPLDGAGMCTAGLSRAD